MDEIGLNTAVIDMSCVQDNKNLALSVTENDIARCTGAIRQYGLLSLPVVGRFQDNTQTILSGECEFLALRGMGVRTVDVVEVRLGGMEEGDKLALLLSSLKKSPNSLSEGLLLKRLLLTGRYTQSEIGAIVGKSISWVNKRLSLVTRLDPAVQELVMAKRLCPHSAQEISRLPEKIQHRFAQKIVMDEIPKSAVEKLVTAYNTDDCPDILRKTIINDPRQILEKLGGKTHIPIRRKASGFDHASSSGSLYRELDLLQRCIYDAEVSLAVIDNESLRVVVPVLKIVKNTVFLFYGYLLKKLEQVDISPGKTRDEEEEG